jgi:hypothetical protein
VLRPAGFVMTEHRYVLLGCQIRFG